MEVAHPSVGIALQGGAAVSLHCREDWKARVKLRRRSGWRTTLCRNQGAHKVHRPCIGTDVMGDNKQGTLPSYSNKHMKANRQSFMQQVKGHSSKRRGSRLQMKRTQVQMHAIEPDQSLTGTIVRVANAEHRVPFQRPKNSALKRVRAEVRGKVQQSGYVVT
jgi:hypothetical protein